jgi:predicted PP-loop superfamily ATPase
MNTTTTKEELQERAQLVRIHEANCRIEYPSKDEANFRLAIMKRFGLQFALKEVRQAQVEGPSTSTAPRPPALARSR